MGRVPGSGKKPGGFNKDGSRNASTGPYRMDPPVDQNGWRRKVKQQKVKFDDVQKGIFLEAVSEHGRKGDAALTAGVCLETVRKHAKDDPDFSSAYEAALMHYRDRVAQEVHRRGVHGWREPVYQKGERVMEPWFDDWGCRVLDEWGMPAWRPASVRKFSDRMLEMEAKRVDHAYRDKTPEGGEGGGGVMVAPEQLSPEDWVRRQQEANEERPAPEGYGDDANGSDTDWTGAPIR